MCTKLFYFDTCLLCHSLKPPSYSLLLPSDQYLTSIFGVYSSLLPTYCSCPDPDLTVDGETDAIGCDAPGPFPKLFQAGNTQMLKVSEHGHRASWLSQRTSLKTPTRATSWIVLDQPEKEMGQESINANQNVSKKPLQNKGMGPLTHQ